MLWVTMYNDHIVLNLEYTHDKTVTLTDFIQKNFITIIYF
jgi:hypothetical protein